MQFQFNNVWVVIEAKLAQLYQVTSTKKLTMRVLSKDFSPSNGTTV
ncbi:MULTISPECIES: hypothetical protein [Nostocaceae]|nr:MULTISPECIES: hypothetical protein [Nostocaceae]MBD2479675.1 hypothetical protein [Anabaena sp. FACHB-83]